MIELWKKLSEEPLTIGRRKLLRRVFLMPDGREAEFVVKDEGSTVAVLALTPSSNVILIQRFLPGSERISFDLPGGGVDAGETPDEAAARELLEETGYRGKVLYAGCTRNCAYSNKIRHGFFARDCVPVQEPKLDRDEFLETVEMSYLSFRALLRKGDVTDVDVAYMALDTFTML